MTKEDKNKEFLEVLEPVRERLSRFCSALARNREDAHDLACETILKAYESFDKIRSKDAFLSYIFSIAARLHRRNRLKRKLFGIFDSEEAENIPANGTNPETGVDVRFLYDAIAKLPLKQAEAVILFEISGFSLLEIREIQGGTLSGVKSRIKRGRKKLAELLNADKISDDKRFNQALAARHDNLFNDTIAKSTIKQST